MFSSWIEAWERPDHMKKISQKISRDASFSDIDIGSSEKLRTDDLITTESHYSSLLSDLSSNESITEKCQNNWKHVKNCSKCKERLQYEKENIKLKQQINNMKFDDNDKIKEYFYMIIAVIVIIFILYIISKKI